MARPSKYSQQLWEVAEGALTDRGTEIIWAAFGNTTRNTGRFRECFRRFTASWDTEQIDSRTVEGVNLVEAERMVRDYGEDSDVVKVRIRGLFPSMSARQFIAEADVAAAYGRHLRPEQYSWAPKILTLDPAWEGDDELVIGLRQGLTVIACHGVWVVAMAERVGDGIWIAALDRHRHGPGGPFRWCSSYEQGRAGAELWVARHETRLREDVAKILAWQEKVRGNRLAKADQDPPFGWMG